MECSPTKPNNKSSLDQMHSHYLDYITTTKTLDHDMLCKVLLSKRWREISLLLFLLVKSWYSSWFFVAVFPLMLALQCLLSAFFLASSVVVILFSLALRLLFLVPLLMMLFWTILAVSFARLSGLATE